MTLEEYKELVRGMTESQKRLGPICDKIETCVKEWLPEGSSFEIHLFEDRVQVSYDGNDSRKSETYPIERFFHEEDR